MNKPIISLYELGCGLGVIAGMELAEDITKPVEGANFKISGIFDSASLDGVKSYLRDLDVSIGTLKGDVEKNITRTAFLQSFSDWLWGWKKFLGDHESTTQILLAGRDVTMEQAKEYGKQLEGWRAAYSRELQGAQPSGVLPSVPVTPESSSFFSVSTRTKVLLVLGGGLVLTALGYATYRYIKKMRGDVERAENLARGIAERTIHARMGSSGSPSGPTAGGGRLEAGE